MTFGRLLKACGFVEQPAPPPLPSAAYHIADEVRLAMAKALAEDGEVYLMIDGDDFRTVEAERLLREAGVSIVVVQKASQCGLTAAIETFDDLPGIKPVTSPPDIAYLRHDPTKNHRRRSRR